MTTLDAKEYRHLEHKALLLCLCASRAAILLAVEEMLASLLAIILMLCHTLNVV